MLIPTRYCHLIVTMPCITCYVVLRVGYALGKPLCHGHNIVKMTISALSEYNLVTRAMTY